MVFEFTRCVVTVKVAFVAPAAIVTFDGTVATLVLLLESDTTAPPAGAAPLSVTVPVEELRPETLVGLRVSEDREAEATQTLLVHVCPPAQVPQLRLPPQPSAALPQLNPSPEQVFGVQVEQTLPMQLCPTPQVPQLRVPPHPSETLPQFSPAGQLVAGVQHTSLLQTPGAAQVPQLRVPPHASEALPQLNPRPAHVFGVQGPVLMVTFALASIWLQVASAATVTDC